MVGKPDEKVIGKYMGKFGEIEFIKSRPSEDVSFIVTFRVPQAAISAMNKPEHFIAGNSQEFELLQNKIEII